MYNFLFDKSTPKCRDRRIEADRHRKQTRPQTTVLVGTYVLGDIPLSVHMSADTRPQQRRHVTVIFLQCLTTAR
jgi:hypothetical protein